jgi:hypothetical protein
MTAANPFVLEKNEYKRDLDIFRHYVDDAATYLHIATKKPLDECREYVLNQLKPGQKFEFKDPTTYYLERKDNGDREKKISTMSKYIGDSVKDEQIIAPTFTTYLSPKVNKSLLVDFIDANVAARSKAKKAMFSAKMNGDKLLEFVKKLEQGNKKISNNSISGAHVSNSTPLFNKTAHSTLTSTCRSTSGYGNANNEKILCGNRHYWNPKIVLNNIISIINHTDYVKLSKAMSDWGIRHPSAAETMECITYSTNLYWKNEQVMDHIRDLVYSLTPEQRSAYTYTGDLYHLAKFNDEVVRTFITRLSMAVRQPCSDSETVFKTHREEYRVLATQFFPAEMRGMTMDKIKGKEIEQFIASTVLNIHQTVTDYTSLIEALFVTDNVPASLAFFPESIRRAALTSDTDSTIFTVQDWVFWKHGNNPGFTAETTATAATMIFLAAETITHVLARMSANMGIESKRIHQIAMKNEYKFDVFIPTQVGKHYFAYISCQEGNIYKDYEMEIKGVHLKSSNVPSIITDKAESMMKEIMDTVVSGKKISLYALLRKVADTEREIVRSVKAGESTYFRSAQIKSPESYTKSEEDSPYQHYTMWQEVFAPKYGDAPIPPYAGVKVNVDLKSSTSMKKWVANIKDKALAQRLESWMIKNQKLGMQTVILPQESLRLKGMPEEIEIVMDIRKIVFDMTGILYLILETLGYYIANDNITRLAMDQY